jgi:hypothetical protein
MKKLKYLIVMVALIFSFSINILAEEKSFSAESKGTVCDMNECIEKVHYEITIKSKKLLDTMHFEPISTGDGISYIDDTYQIYGNLYGYDLRDENFEPITDLGEEVEILIQDDELIENMKYKVYYLDDITYPMILDKKM